MPPNWLLPPTANSPGAETGYPALFAGSAPPVGCGTRIKWAVPFSVKNKRGPEGAPASIDTLAPNPPQLPEPPIPASLGTCPKRGAALG